MKLIATPFVKLWRWIKDTAWIQPLLIVGIIFGIIFSIQPFVNWIKSLNSDETATVNYFKGYKKSLDGILDVDSKEGKSKAVDHSEAGELISNLITAQEAFEGTDEQAKANALKNLPAEKFFLAFVQDSCSGCSEAKKGFKTLQDNWGKDYYVPRDQYGNELKDQKFNLITIFCDESVENKTDNTSLKPFAQLLDNYPQFFENSAAKMYDTFYFIDGKVDKTKLGYFESGDSANFQTPTILLMDFTGDYDGASEILFNIPNEGGNDTDQAKARTLIDCWNHTGDFAFKSSN